ncbi:MAG: transposase [Anaerolineaceae bacterium]|nr:transposase [Anaerolineaceae bacterium]
MRTNNGLEGQNREIYRRTSVSAFPNETSCLWLVSAVLMGQSGEWKAAKLICKSNLNRPFDS